MSRARNLKPGFFKNEALAELHPLARILFAGLWTIADREGRMEDRPKRIKADVLPYDRCDVDGLLQVLHDAEFILRYNDDFNRYIQILTWHKHQKPHIKEAPSTIPAPNKHLPRSVLDQCKVGASTDLGDDEHYTKTPSSLVVGSLNLVAGNGTATPLPQDVSDYATKQTVSPDNGFGVSDAFERIYARHPKKGHRGSAERAYAQIDSIGHPGTRCDIDTIHAEWCDSEEWTWKNGAKAPYLDEWLIDKGYKYAPKRPTVAPGAPSSLAAKLLAEAEELERRGL